jgi:hypothetical protein
MMTYEQPRRIFGENKKGRRGARRLAFQSVRAKKPRTP